MDVTPKALPSLVVGGPFHRLMGRAGMLGDDRLPTLRAAAVVGFAGWAIGALLALAQFARTGDAALLTYFVDAVPYAHALVAVTALLAVERTTDARLSALIDHPLRHGLVAAVGAPRYRAAVARADARSSSTAAEFVLLAAALALCLAFATGSGVADGPGWSRIDGAKTWAGAWQHYVVGALLSFLALRWMFRFAVWSLLLATLARLPLVLVPTHPDKAAGLGFLAAFPMLFAGLVLALGAAVGAKLFDAAVYRGAPLEELGTGVAVWAVGVLAVLVGPLLLFAPALLRLRERALVEVGGRAVGLNRTFWQAAERDDALAPEPAAVNAVNTLYDRAAAIQPLIVSRQTTMQLLTIALLPMLPALATHVPVSRLIRLVLGGA
jgi:hypothetical protein